MTSPGGRLGRRLSRILMLLPYAIQHPGTTVNELSRRFDIPKNELINDLNLVFLCGLPGYGPGDLIDVDFQGERIYIHMADYFAAPLRVTSAEGLALYAGGQAIAALPGMEQAESLRNALDKLGRALGATRGEEDLATIEVRVEETPPDLMATLQNALRDRKRVEMEYRSASSGETAARTVDPWALMTATGRWYLIALDHRTGEERMFRVDRIKRATLMEEDAPAPQGLDLEKYKGGFVGREGQPILKMEISPDAARWFEDYYPVRAAREVTDGWREVELFSSGDRWAAIVVLGLGSEVRNVTPASVVDMARELASTMAERHS